MIYHCDIRVIDHWLSDGVSNPYPASLEDLICCLLLGPFPDFSVADGLKPSDPKESSKEGIDECEYYSVSQL